MSSDEERLLREARRWNEAALEEIYDRFYPGLYRYAVYLLGDGEAAEECVADVFARFLDILRRGKGPKQNLKAYLYRMVHNWAYEQFRRRRTLSLDDLPIEALRVAQESLEEGTDKRWKAERLREALNHIPPRQAQVLILRFLEGFSFEDIAATMGISVGAVKALQHRGVENLKRILREQ